MSKFTVLKGGLPDHPRHEFVEASITDTRLMGVLGLRVHWLVYPLDETNISAPKNIYHFYYFDIEEIGLDFLNIYELDGEDGVKLATTSCFGGLGACMKDITEKEARYLIKYFVTDTVKKGETLPENINDIKFLVEDDISLTKEEEILLGQKMCTDIKTPYGVVNYYLMRMFGRDFEGAVLLINGAANPEDFDAISLPSHATFLKNDIEEFVNNDESISYLSESLVESEDVHYIVTSEIKLADNKVLYAKKKDSFPISINEASLILTRREFCNVYRIIVPMDDFDIDFTTISIGTTKTAHECGDMFMEFKPDNEHVENKSFRLYNDLEALYFVTDYGELIVAAYSLRDILDIEQKLMVSQLGCDIVLTGRMQFANSMLYEFAQSGFSSFDEFIKSLE